MIRAFVAGFVYEVDRLIGLVAIGAGVGAALYAIAEWRWWRQRKRDVPPQELN